MCRLILPATATDNQLGRGDPRLFKQRHQVDCCSTTGAISIKRQQAGGGGVGDGSAASVATGAPPEVAGFQGVTAGRPAVFLASLKASSKLQMAFHPQGLVVA